MKLQINHNEADILEKVAQGDTQAFSKLFYGYHQELAGYIFKLIKSSELTEEIVQDTFLKIWTQRESLHKIDNFRAYLFTMSRNYTFNVMRAETRKLLHQQQWVAEQMSAMPEDVADLERKFSLLDEAIAQLPSQQRKVWTLSRKDGLKQEEIARHLQLSRETVKRHISLATSSIIRFVQHKSDTLLFILLFLAHTLFARYTW